MTNIVFKWSADVCTKTNTHARDQSLNTSTRHQEVSYVFNKEGTIASQFVCYFSILWAKTAKKQNTYFCNFWHFKLNLGVFNASVEGASEKFRDFTGEQHMTSSFSNSAPPPADAHARKWTVYSVAYKTQTTGCIRSSNNAPETKTLMNCFSAAIHKSMHAQSQWA